KGIIDIVTFIVNQGAQIVEFVGAVLDAVIQIANGGQAGVPKMVETALAASIPLLLGFLASLLGIGSLANKVKSVFHSVSKPVNRAIDKLVDLIAKKGKALWQKLKNKVRGGDDTPAGKQRRLDKALRAAVAALVKFKDRPVGRKALSPILAAIRRRYGLKELSPMPAGRTWSVRGAVNPVGSASTEAQRGGENAAGAVVEKKAPLPGNLVKAIKEGGRRFLSLYVHPAWARVISKPGLGSSSLWRKEILEGTEAAALAHLSAAAPLAASSFSKDHPRANPNSDPESVFWNYFFGVQGKLRKDLLSKAGGEAGVLPHLKDAANREEVKKEAEIVSILEEMEFYPSSSRHAPYGYWEPFPSGEKDADVDLVAAINGQKEPQIINFLRAMVRGGSVGGVSWGKFVTLWDDDSTSRDFVKNRFRSVFSGQHEWIPTDQIKEVLESSIRNHRKSDVLNGTNIAIAWLELHHALRSSTNQVIWKIADKAGNLSVGAHVGTFYDEKGKAAFTDGTVDFHNELRELYSAHKDGKPSDFVSVLLGILRVDKEAPPGDVRLLWSGDITGLDREQSIGARFREGRGKFVDLTLQDLADRQEEAFRSILDLFEETKKKIEGIEKEAP
ncbi:hypothetical protein ACFVQ4_19975, partial [Streptomyces laurentii]